MTTVRPPGVSARIHCLGRVLLAALLLVHASCVSAKYKKAGPDALPPVAINLAVSEPAIATTLHTVIVYKGPGAWKKAAYWDEYIVSVANAGASPLSLESALLTDALAVTHSAGSNPWDLEKASRENLQMFERHGRKILLGAGITVGWVASAGLTVGAAFAGAGALAAVGAATFVGLPVWALSSGLRGHNARKAIDREFNRRRIALPAVLPPGETKQGSFFFPVSPGPRRMELRFRTGGVVQTTSFDLTPLAGLHLLKQLAGEAPPPTATAP